MFLRMSIYVCLLLIFVIAVNSEKDNWSVRTTGDGLEAYNDCVQILNISIDDVVRIEEINDPLNRRILKCVYVEMGFYTEGRGFHVDRIVKQLGGGESIEKVVKRCVPTSSNDASDVQIVQTEKCFKMEKIGGYQD